MPKDIQVKNFRVTLLKKPLKTATKYEVDVRAVSEKDALDKAYSRIGSKHRVSRQLLEVHSIKEVKAIELKNPVLREIASNDNIKIQLE